MNGVRRVEEKLDERFDVLLNKKKKEAKERVRRRERRIRGISAAER